MKIKTRRYYLYYLLKVFLWVASLIPLKVSIKIAGFLGKIVSRIIPKYSRVAEDNLKKAFGFDEDTVTKTAENVFVNLAKNGAEWIKLSSFDPKKLDKIVTESEGLEQLDNVLSEGKGAVVLGFHFGNWELLGLYLKYKGYDGALVARKIYFHKYNKIVNKLRNRFGARVIYREDSPKKMLKELKNGNILGVVPDQDVDSINGAFVNFFGRPAYTPTAPVKIAMAAKTKLIPIFVVRKKDDTHKLVVEKPIDLSGVRNTEENVKLYTQKWTNVLEAYVKKYPDQWVWVHRRWKTKEPV
ncbi:MAG: lysophospholipid acyltransferase family protein [Candidatus Omnitrophota bacterium]|nr:lysophospholipid acyltransferase family protein [Candidatus Omnitrophota bacterium]